MKTKNLTFMEAVEQMKLGKKVRRATWKQGRTILKGGYDLTSNLISNDEDANYNNLFVSIKDIEATDWEVVDDDSDWNLADTPDEYTPMVFKFKYNDVKKCRDLILEDIKQCDSGVYSVDMQQAIFKLSKIINKRFGDLK